MRASILLAILLAVTMTVSGCFGGNDKKEEDHCADGHKDPECPTAPTNGTSPVTPPTMPPPPPNAKPTLALVVTDANGTVTNMTVVGGSLTFSAQGSVDPDGTLEAVAIVVQDVNRTFPAQTLVKEGTFTAATFLFEHAGPVQISLQGIDDRGGLASLQSMVFVNSFQPLGSFQFSGAMAAAAATPEACQGPTGNDILDNPVYHRFGFTTTNQTTYVVANLTEGAGEFAICSPDGTAISEVSTTGVTTIAGTVFVTTAPGADYYLSVFSTSPVSGTAQNKVAFEVIVHFEPQPAAAA